MTSIKIHVSFEIASKTFLFRPLEELKTLKCTRGLRSCVWKRELDSALSLLCSLLPLPLFLLFFCFFAFP